MSARDKEALHPDVPRRKTLKVAVSALCSEIGYGKAEDAALETLVEMLQSFISELGRSGQAYCELAGRTQPMCSDVVMALIDMGTDVHKLPAYAKRQNKLYIMPPSTSAPTKPPSILQAGDKLSHPSHIPEYLPTFPDPHTYIQTEMHKKPITEYQIIREKAASQKRDVERALTKFMAKTGETEKLFEDDPYAFPLIASKPSELPYMEALLVKNEDLEVHEEDDKKHSPEKIPIKEESQSKSEKELEKNTDSPENGVKIKEEDSKTNQEVNPSDSDNAIDNPYLRPIKMPRLKGGKVTKSSKW